MKPKKNSTEKRAGVAVDAIVRHCWRSACDPANGGYWKTFSMSFQRIVPKASGNGTKMVPVGFRLSGPSSKREEVIKRAEEIVAMLDAGWTPTKKSESWKNLKDDSPIGAVGALKPEADSTAPIG